MGRVTRISARTLVKQLAKYNLKTYGTDRQKILLTFRGDNENKRILNFVTRLNRTTTVKKNDKNVETFIKMLTLIKNRSPH